MTRLSPDDAQALATFLADARRPQGTFTYHQLQGFLFGVVCSPEMIPPSDWLPVIFDDASANYANEHEASVVMDHIMSLYNELNEAATDGLSELPADCTFRVPVEDNLDEDSPMSQWCQGFTAAYHWLENVWEDYLPESLEDEMGSVLMVLSVFVSRSFAESFVSEGEPADESGGPISLHDYLELAREVFSDAMCSFADLGRNELAAGPPPVAAPTTKKVGRNAPCPCGSGRKYKNCCGSVVH